MEHEIAALVSNSTVLAERVNGQGRVTCYRLFAPAPTIRLNYICGFGQMGWASQLAAKESITELNKLLCISRRHSRPEWGICISTFETEGLGCIMRYVGLVFIEWGDCISVLVISKCSNWVSHIAPCNTLMVFNEWRICIFLPSPLSKESASVSGSV